MTAAATVRVEHGSLPVPDAARVLTAPALDFIARLHRQFNPTRLALLARRTERQRSLDRGELPDFLAETAHVRESAWVVAPAPADLDDRRVEITGPPERKMMINALNSGAKVFMADFEDALSPTWENVVAGQGNAMDAVRRTLALSTPEGREYRLAERTATLVIRPRGWHLTERHVRVDGEAISASLCDLGLYLFHNARELLARGSGPYFYLPKLESHREARLWNDVFVAAQVALGLPRGTIRATVLIETILAAFEMEEILYELREHASGLNAGRWDYIFSAIKKFRGRRDVLFPDRSQMTMTVPFMRAYTEQLVRVCHRRGAHAIGGMAAFIPSRRDAAVNDVALRNVREDKERESRDGFDGTWVAHPDLVPVASEVFGAVLMGPDGTPRPHQKSRLREDVAPDAASLLDLMVPNGRVTHAGVRSNISIALQYLDAWLRGSGAVAIADLMEDTATAEIARAQLWQWIRHGAVLEDGTAVTRELYRQWRRTETDALRVAVGGGAHRLDDAAALLDSLVLNDVFTEFLTIPGYAYLR